MLQKFAKKYLAIIFLFASLMGSMHHHKDMQVHSDCKICVVHARIANADTPVDVCYVTPLTIYSESILTSLFTPHQQENISTLHARAPPFFS
jgi:hypothetical protein